MGYFHVYTKGLEDRLIFRDKKDFITGMNLVAVVCFSVDVRLLAFVLMSNYVHFVIKGSRKEVEGFLRRVETSIDAVDCDGDGLKRLIAYVLNNPVRAGIKCVPQGYEWSSARCYFTSIDVTLDTITLGELGVVKVREMFHSKKKLPSQWRVCSSGYVLPESYVDADAVERCLGSCRSFEYFLSSSLAARRGLNEIVTFSDAVLKADVSELDYFLKAHLVRDIKSRFGASTQQLARVVGMTLREVLRYLE